MTVTDDAGHALTLAKPAGRVIALYGAFNELLLGMGLDERIVARTAADRDIPRLRDRPAVGTHMRPNPELIVSLSPDVVLQLQGRQEADLQSDALRKLGVNVLVFRMNNFAEMFSVLRRLGTLTGEESKAARLEERLQGRLDALRRGLQGVRPARVFYEVRYPNLLGAGPDSIVNDVMEHAGARNVVRTAGKVVRLNEEELIAADPDVYLIQKGPMNPEPRPLAERRHYNTLRAVREGRFLVVDEALFARPGPRAVDAAEQLARWLHPSVEFQATP